MSPGLQPRKMLLLEEDVDRPLRNVKEILKSPLGLAKILVCLAFGQDQSGGLMVVRQTLDSIKRMAAGLGSAEQRGKSYKIADYAVYLFAFQQFFHSSYRARQGNVLEAAIRRILADAGTRVYEKKEHNEILRSKLGIATKAGHDLDVMSTNGSEHLLVQIRSRDDTGGTTAKGRSSNF